MPNLQISAIVCTHNRADYLGMAIDSLLAQDFAGGFEVIVVDNASGDQTRAVVESRQSDSRLRYIHEATIGLSIARNTGAKAAISPLLAYLDDDAIASPHWLRVLHELFQAHKKLAIVGGKVTLQWAPDTAAPSWLSPALAENLGAYDLGDALVYIDRPQLTPRGLNYSIRRDFLNKIGGFDPKLGRVGKNLLSNEELHLTERALRSGWQVAYLPTAQVAHQVSPERLQPRWFLRRSWWQGISDSYREQLTGRADKKQLLQGGDRLLRGLYKALKYANDPALRFENLVYAYGQIGYLKTAIGGIWSKADFCRHIRP